MKKTSKHSKSSALSSLLFPGVEIDLRLCIVCGAVSGAKFEYDDENDDGELVAITVDRFRLPWCQRCAHRSRVLAWAARKGWPHVDTGRCEVVEQIGWFHLLLLENRQYADSTGRAFVNADGNLLFPDFRDQPTNDELIWLLLAYIEMQEEEASAS
jgi:hypothetical protein